MSADSSSPFDRLQRPLNAGQRLVTLTAYDYPTARLVDEAGVDLVLVGDSLGMVFAGLPDTTGVTMEHMLYHTTVVARGVRQALLVADLPFRSYETPEETVRNGRRLIDAGAHAVKLEGGAEQLPQLEALRDAGIPTVGHIGMLPQHVREEGGYKKKGKTSPEAERLVDSARALEAVGVGAIVLESIVPSVAKRITEAIRIPTIGIGSGPDCDGEIRVIHDVIGAFPWFVPPFAKPEADVAGDIRGAIAAYAAEVRSGNVGQS
ncbi:MAG: 3-methyl-2-oxobutanoate hydroxymethyltransferase [Verrucomicrobiae bacterium]|nr:3-methyl-2-oxobutanoate hydroxymethyltransferase [Verrucomicrobiae bacterium]